MVFSADPSGVTSIFAWGEANSLFFFLLLAVIGKLRHLKVKTNHQDYRQN